MQYYKLFILFILSSTSALVCAGNPTAHPQKLSLPGFSSGIYQSDSLFISGQPLSDDAIKKLQGMGLTTIVNLRTTEEVANPELSPIDEQALSATLGLNYFHLPSGGEEEPYSPATVTKFADIMEQTDGKVLLHCAIGRRASHLWVAYLINYQDVPIDTAIDLGREANFGSIPLEGYLKGTINRLLTH